MSNINLNGSLAALFELHGSNAILDALQAACAAASDHTAVIGDRTSPVAEAWQKATLSLRFAAAHVARAERGDGIELSDALTVLDETLAVAS